ncbi:DMT family transporter [Alicyclobacillus curvatus]|nr:DMT family transporter [Alicyclobacillus curvatus]
MFTKHPPASSTRLSHGSLDNREMRPDGDGVLTNSQDANLISTDSHYHPQHEHRRNPLFPSLPLFVGVAAVSFSAILIKVCQVPAAAIGMYRLLITVALLSPFTLLSARQRLALRALSKRDLLALVASGLLLGMHFLFWIASLKETSVASSMIITTLQPAFVGIAAYFAFHERLSRQRVISLILALLGTAVIAIGDDARTHVTSHLAGVSLLGSSSALRGDLLSLLGTLCVSGYMLVGQHARARLTSTAYNWSVFFVAGLGLMVYAGMTGVPFHGYRPMDWLWLLLLALVPTLFGHALFNWLLRYVNATTVSVTILGEPIGAILLSAWLLHEPIFAYQMQGGLVTLGGIWLYLYKGSQAKP